MLFSFQFGLPFLLYPGFAGFNRLPSILISSTVYQKVFDLKLQTISYFRNSYFILFGVI